MEQFRTERRERKTERERERERERETERQRNSPDVDLSPFREFPFSYFSR